MGVVLCRIAPKDNLHHTSVFPLTFLLNFHLSSPPATVAPTHDKNHACNHQNPPRTLSCMSSPAITAWQPKWAIGMDGPYSSCVLSARIGMAHNVTLWSHWIYLSLSPWVTHQLGEESVPGTQRPDMWRHGAAPLPPAFHRGFWMLQALGGQPIAGPCPGLHVEVPHQ